MSASPSTCHYPWLFYIGSEADLDLHACTSTLLTEESPSPDYLFITRMFSRQEPHYQNIKCGQWYLLYAHSMSGVSLFKYDDSDFP